MLLEAYARLVTRWRSAFAQQRTMVRVVTLLLGLLCTYGRRTVSNAILVKGGGRRGWAADYLAFSRARWDVASLFDAVFSGAIEQHDRVAPTDPVVVLLDDTSLKKSSRRIEQAQWLRDPLSPPFRINLKYGLRCLHLALRLPLHKVGFAARAISVAFELAPSAKKPGRKATPEQHVEYVRLQKEMSLPSRAVRALGMQRQRLDALGMSARTLLAVVDGGYTNRAVLGNLPERTHLIGRVRKDLALFRPAEPGKHRKVYGDRLATPEALRRDDAVPYRTVVLHYGGTWRSVRYKEVREVLWRGGARRRRLRLFVLAPTPYRAPGKGKRKLAYGEPAYLLCTDLDSPTDFLLQSYLDRWQIEPLHRDLKTGLGVGQAQAWSKGAVVRIHSAFVAAYSMLVLAALSAFGPGRTDAFPPLPAWRRLKPNHRASHHDLVTLLREDLSAATANYQERLSQQPPLRVWGSTSSLPR